MARPAARPHHVDGAAGPGPGDGAFACVQHGDGVVDRVGGGRADAFHIALFSACRNPYLVRALQDYMGLTLPMRAKNLADPAGLKVSRQQHDMMIDLLRGRDSWALAQLSVQHMQLAKTDYLARIARPDRTT